MVIINAEPEIFENLKITVDSEDITCFLKRLTLTASLTVVQGDDNGIQKLLEQVNRAAEADNIRLTKNTKPTKIKEP